MSDSALKAMKEAAQGAAPGARPLAGRHAIVTGGGSGIGAAIADALAARGAKLTLMGRDPRRIEAKAGEFTTAHDVEAIAEACDVTDADRVIAAFAAAAARLGPADILIANAGAAESAPLERTDAALWHAMLAVNLTGAFQCIRVAVPSMRAAGWGRVVTVASTAGLKGYPYVSAYCAAKHGLVGLTRALAAELAATGVTVNAVCPSYTDTDLVTRSAAKIAGKTGGSPEEMRAAFAKTVPLGRLIAPEEVAAAVAWLCLDEAAGVTGVALPIAGGEV